MRWTSRLLGAALLVTTAGCRTPAPEASPPPPMRKVSEPVKRPTALPLRDALALTLAYNPDLQAFAYDVRAAEARLIQAAVVPNPELGIELAEFDRDGMGMDSSETVISLGQVIELGGKRRQRKAVATRETDLAGWQYESQRLNAFKTTAQRFAEVLAAERRLDLATSVVHLARQTSKAVSERVQAGKEPPVQATKAAAELEMALLDAAKAKADLAVSRKSLAAMWGDTRPHFKRLVGDLGHIHESLPSIEAVLARLSANPDLESAEAVVRLRRAAVDAEKASRIPDLNASVGIQNFKEDDTDALTVGLSIPLPVFDRNQGNLSAAQHGLEGARARQRAMQAQLTTALITAHARLASAQQTALVYRSKVIPAMQEAFDAAHQGYGQGKFGFLEVLDAQRSLFASQAGLLDALTAYHMALADIERLTATSIESIMTNNTKDKQ